MGFAVGFYQDLTELVGTANTVQSFSPPVLEYLHGIVIAGIVIVL